MKKVVTIVGTRPEIIKLSCVIKELDAHFQHILIHTGQNYDKNLNEIFFSNLKLKTPNYYLGLAKNDSFETIGSIISKTGNLLKQIMPDAILVYGDTNSCLSVISAKKLKIPIFHMEAGNRCFDQRVPEEVNRKIVDHLSDVNFVVSEHARKYLINEGIPINRIIKTGSNMVEVINKFKKEIDNSDVLTKLNIKNSFFLLSLHREENVDDMKKLKTIIEALNEASEEFNAKIIFPCHPRTKTRIKEFNIEINQNFMIIEPLNFTDYVKLQMNCICLLSDSGTVTEESSILGLPSIMLRQTHERPEGSDFGISILANIKKNDILESIKLAIDHNTDGFKINNLPDNANFEVSKIVVRNIQSYIHHVNFYTWHKSE